MKSLPAVFLILCTAINCLSQNNRAVGQVVDSSSLSPLAFVNIISETSRQGTSTDEQGRFSFKYETSQQEDQVKFSAIGFKSKYIKLQDLRAKVIYLQASVNQLDEVQLYQIKNKHSKRINDFSNRNYIGLGNFSGGQFPSTVARFYEKPEKFKTGCFFKSIEVRFFSEGALHYNRAKFRLRILASDKDGKPSYDMLPEGLLLEKSPNQFNIKVDLLAYRLAMPDNGCFVAVEHLFIEENKYVVEKDYRVNDTMLYQNIKTINYAPIFKGVLEKNDVEFASYFKDVTGWKKMNMLNTSNAAFKGRLPSPAFKIIFTD